MNTHEFQQIAKRFRAGKISLRELTDQVFASTTDEPESSDDAWIRGLVKKLNERQVDSHKGDFGRVLIVAGSPGMAGGAGLAGLAALRSGAGSVTVATDPRCQSTVASFHPALMTLEIPWSDQEELPDDANLESLISGFDCIAVGPGMGRSERARKLVTDIVKNSAVPVVVDADGLNNLGAGFGFDKLQTRLILTPHPGEMNRLADSSVKDRKELETSARHLAASFEGVVVLKGHRTLITDGKQSTNNSSGNPGMATAGSGDVLTGVIAAFVGQGMSIWESAVAGCFVHGKAGDHAARRSSQVSMIATDIIDCLPLALSVP